MPKLESRWTPEENEILITNYKDKSVEELKALLPNRTWDAIKLHANKANLKRYYNTNRFSKLSILLEETSETYYWIGFIMADGHLTKNNRLCVNLNALDIHHLEKLKKFISCDKELLYQKRSNSYSLHCMDVDIIQKFKIKFNITNNKTTEPCDISSIKDDNLFLSWLAGFIDGDGCIKRLQNRPDCNLTIKVHANWLDNLEYIKQRIVDIFKIDTPSPIVNNAGYSRIVISNSKILQALKNRLLTYNIPLLSRKWDIIDLNFISRYEKSRIPTEMIKQAYNITKNINEICKITGLTYEYVYSRVYRVIRPKKEKHHVS